MDGPKLLPVLTFHTEKEKPFQSMKNTLGSLDPFFSTVDSKVYE